MQILSSKIMNKVVVVTGGVGQLGSAICLELEKAGYQVLTTDIKSSNFLGQGTILPHL